MRFSARPSGNDMREREREGERERVERDVQREKEQEQATSPQTGLALISPLRPCRSPVSLPKFLHLLGPA